jgi:hypothetical protein
MINLIKKLIGFRKCVFCKQMFFIRRLKVLKIQDDHKEYKIYCCKQCAYNLIGE